MTSADRRTLWLAVLSTALALFLLSSWVWLGFRPVEPLGIVGQILRPLGTAAICFSAVMYWRKFWRRRG